MASFPFAGAVVAAAWLTLLSVIAAHHSLLRARRRATRARLVAADPAADLSPRHGGDGIGRGRRPTAKGVVAAVPELVELFELAVGGGLNVRLALDVVAARAPPPLRPSLQATARLVQGGARTADALTLLPDHLGEPVRPLVTALVASERYGTPLLPALERVRVEARARRRMAADEAARRVPVKLLFPLVLCVLPAFGLLTIAPLLAGALRALRL